MSIAEQRIKEAPTDVLCRAAGTLQEAHDYVESHVFNVGAYGAAKDAGACCFIGSVRQVAGEHDQGPWENSRQKSSDLALLALDRAVIEMGGKEYHQTPGVTAENFGMGHPKWGHSQEGALQIYRQALREMQTELMGRENLPQAKAKLNRRSLRQKLGIAA